MDEISCPCVVFYYSLKINKVTKIWSSVSWSFNSIKKNQLLFATIVNNIMAMLLQDNNVRTKWPENSLTIAVKDQFIDIITIDLPLKQHEAQFLATFQSEHQWVALLFFMAPRSNFDKFDDRLTRFHCCISGRITTVEILLIVAHRPKNTMYACTTFFIIF